MHKLSLAAAAMLVASQIGSASAQTAPTDTTDLSAPIIVVPAQPLLRTLSVPTSTFGAGPSADQDGNDRGDNGNGNLPVLY